MIPSHTDRPVDARALGGTMRSAGALLVVASASTFLFQRWEVGNDLFRYALLAAHAPLLAGAAYFCGLGVREGRGARTLLAILLSVVSVAFTVLGALVHSQFHLDPLVQLPSHAIWIAPSPLWALGTVLASLAVFTPLVLIAFAALARPRAKSLTSVFLFANLLLLIPVRDPSLVIWLIAALAALLFRFQLKAWTELRTLEGNTSRMLAAVPLLLMFGRTVTLYDPSAAFVGGSAMIAGAGFWLWAPRTTNPTLRDLIAWSSAAFLAGGWTIAAHSIDVGSPARTLLLLALPSAAAFALAARRAVKTGRVMTAFAASIAGVAALVAPVVGLETLTALACLITGLLVACAGAAFSSNVLRIAGGLVSATGLVLEVVLATQAHSLLGWVSLTILGIGLVVGASYVERHKSMLPIWWARWRTPSPT